MKSPLSSGQLVQLESVGSTQEHAADLLRSGQPVGVVMAHHQTAGRGRFDRTWVSGPGDSLTASLVFAEYADHARPHLIGMALAVAASGALHCSLRWPNDLIIGGKKLGGILTEVITIGDGRRVPVVGLGVNLNQEAFPPELPHATSVLMAQGHRAEPLAVLNSVLARLELLPEPSDWSDIESAWMLFDDTPGKVYKLQDGKQAVAIGIGPHGELLAAVEGESTSILAADAILG